MIEKIISNRKNIGALTLQRFLPQAQQRMIGAYIFFDYFGPTQFQAYDGINVRPHPHIGLSTLTYLFEGAILHRDSLGSEQEIQVGDVNLMVAGRGITHSERESEVVHTQPHRLHGVQIWLALPYGQEEIDPGFLHYGYRKLPRFTENNADVTVVMGEWLDYHSPVKQHCPTTLFDIAARQATELTVPTDETHEYGVLVIEGRVKFADEILCASEMAQCSAQDLAKLSLDANTRLLVFGGQAFTSPRKIFWNFVARDYARLEQAKADWVAQRFPIIPHDNDERLEF